MTNLDTVARRHAEVTRLAASHGDKPGVDAITDRHPPGGRQFSWLPAVAAALLVLIVGVAGSLLVGGGDRTTSPLVVTNGFIVLPDDWSPLAITPDGQRADFELPAKVRLGEEGSLTWAPDGRRMAVITYEGELVIVDTTTGTADPVEVALECLCRLDWSPDGSTIAVTESGDGSLSVIDTDSWTKTSVIDPGVSSPLNPSWSPDSAWIAFGFVDGSSSGVAKVRPDGTGFTVLTEQFTGSAHWSPTSDRIAVLTASRVGDFAEVGPQLQLELVMVDAAGSGQQLIAELGLCACLGLSPGFAWSPDGTMLVVDMPGPDASSPPPGAGDWGVYLMDDTGTVLRQIRGEGGSGEPAWQPVMSPAD